MKKNTLESTMVKAITSAEVPRQEVLRKVVAQPQTYSSDDVRHVRRYGLRWRLKPRDYFQWHQFYGFWDEVLQVLCTLAQRSQVVFDVGANIGFYSLAMAQQLSEGQVLSFEPNPDTLAHLREHILLNHLNNITASPLALSDGQGSAQLRDFGDGESGKFSLRDLDMSADGSAATVDTASLDGQMQKHRFDRLDLIKVDVEGHEPEVFLGAKQSITKHLPYLCFELTPRWYADRPEKTKAAFSYLIDAGYEFSHILPYVPAPPQMRPIDLLTTVMEPSDTLPQLNVFGRHKDRHPPWSELRSTSAF